MIDKDLIITQQDLVDWIDRPASNDDLDLCSYLSNAVKNQYEYKEEIEKLTAESTEWESKYYQLQNIIDELDAMFDGDLDGFFTINEKGACNEIIEIIQNYKDKLNELKGDNE